MSSAVTPGSMRSEAPIAPSPSLSSKMRPETVAVCTTPASTSPRLPPMATVSSFVWETSSSVRGAQPREAVALVPEKQRPRAVKRTLYAPGASPSKA